MDKRHNTRHKQTPKIRKTQIVIFLNCFNPKIIMEDEYASSIDIKYCKKCGKIIKETYPPVANEKEYSTSSKIEFCTCNKKPNWEAGTTIPKI